MMFHVIFDRSTRHAYQSGGAACGGQVYIVYLSSYCKQIIKQKKNSDLPLINAMKFNSLFPHVE